MDLIRKLIARVLRLFTGPRKVEEIRVDFGWQKRTKSWGWIQEDGRLGPDIARPRIPVVLKAGEALRFVIDKLVLPENQQLETCYIQLVNVAGTDNTTKTSVCVFELNGDPVAQQTICIPSMTQPATSHFVDMVLPSDPKDPHYNPDAPRFKINARNEILVHNKGPPEIKAKTFEIFMVHGPTMMSQTAE